MSLQATGTILEPPRRRSSVVPGNFLAQWSLESSISSPSPIPPLQKLRCARYLTPTAFCLARTTSREYQEESIWCARVAELADALDSGSSEYHRTGSSPVAGT